ncbi:MAG: hypothetical protein HKP61_04215 [Dactylosporangium sp.]|nr:restriction endonuclease [Dactylosporangium sp.]NNJ60157.1 hypothetical protein [Dactylosporangium sp.]
MNERSLHLQSVTIDGIGCQCPGDEVHGPEATQVTTPRATKKIAPEAYNALAEALAVVYWNKKPWIRYVRGLFDSAPELLSGIGLESETKRDSADNIVARLMANEHKYQALTVTVMLNVARMDRFPNLEAQPDKERFVPIAEAAVAELRRWTERHQEIVDEHEAYTKQLEDMAAQAEKTRAFAEQLASLRDAFLMMHSATDHQARGFDFEKFINQMFGLFDLEPRAAYSLDREQIDGAFSFDTDDYVLEARWWKTAMGRGHLDIFKAKIERKGKNALGLYISVNGFTKDALDEYSDSTPFITMDGQDFMAVLDDRIRLDDLLRRKKRHANETGHCYFPATNML